MAISDVVFVQSIQTKKSGIDEFDVRLHCTTDDPTDDVVVVANDPALPAILEPYAWDGSIDITSRVLTKTPRPLKSSTQWEVRLRYGDPSSQEDSKKDKDDENTEDPTAWQPEITVTSSTYSYEAYDTFEYLGPNIPNVPQAPGAAPGVYWMPNKKTFGRQRVAPITHFRMTRWFITYDWALFSTYFQAINDAPLTITWPGLNPTFAKHTVLCDSINGTWEYRNNIFVWRVDFALIYNALTWNFFLQPKDTDEWDGAAPGDNTWETLKNKDGTPIQSPVMLNVNGKPALNAAEATAALQSWREYEEMDFDALPLDE